MRHVSKSNVLRSDTSATHFAELCTLAGKADPTNYARLKYLSVREVKAMPADELTASYISWDGCRVHLWVETTRAGNRRFYTRSERV